MNVFLDFILKRSALVLVAFLMVAAFFIMQIPKFQLDASSDSLVLENDKNLLYYQAVKKNYGSDDYLVISYQVEDNLLAVDQLEHLKKLKNALQNIDQVKSVTTILDVPLFSSPPIALTELGTKTITIAKGNADLKLAHNEFRTSPIYANNLVSKDSKTTAILVSLSSSKTFAKMREKRNEMREKRANNQLSVVELARLEKIEKKVLKNASIASKQVAHTIEEIRTTLDKYNDKARLFLGGLPMITTDIVAYIADDLIVFSLAVIGLMIVTLALIFKGVRWVVIPVFVSIIVATITTGIIALLGWKVTVISSNFFSLLLVLTLSIIIHLVVYYRQAAHDQPDAETSDLIRQSVHKMFKPCLFTTLTTIAAFGSFLVSGIRPVIDFGWMMSIGVVIALALSFLLFPILMNLLPKTQVKLSAQKMHATTVLAKLTEHFGNQLITIIIVIMIVAGLGISQLTVENRFIDYFKKDTEINQGLSTIDQKLGGTIPLEIIFDDLAEDYWFDDDLRLDIHKIHQHIEKMDETGKVLSIDTLMQLLTRANNDEPVNGFFLNVIKNKISERTKSQILSPYLSEKTGQLRMVVRIQETSQNLERDKLIQKIQTYISQDMGFKADSFHMTGMLVLYNNMLQSLFDSQIKTIAMVFAMIFLMFLWIFKSISLSLIALIPNTVPSAIILGGMGLAGISLDLMTITIAAIAIGIGVDDAIHYIHRFKAEFKSHNGDYVATMYAAHKSVGLAMFYTSITIAIGFLILTLSNFIPSIYFGLFTVIAMISAMLVNLTLLPKLLLIFKPKIH